jgi:hypothetical protein
MVRKEKGDAGQQPFPSPVGGADSRADRRAQGDSKVNEMLVGTAASQLGSNPIAPIHPKGD